MHISFTRTWVILRRQRRKEPHVLCCEYYYLCMLVDMDWVRFSLVRLVGSLAVHWFGESKVWIDR